MRRVILALGFAIGLTALGAGAALADGGPHGGYTNPITLPTGTTGMLPSGTVNTDGCAGCHRAHTAQADAALLKEKSVYQLCADCHNGSGSVLDVLGGVRLTSGFNGGLPDPTLNNFGNQGSGPAVAAGALPLNGGGFMYFKGQPVTSRHELFTGDFETAGGVTAAWGSGAAPPGVTAPFKLSGAPDGQLGAALECTTCHSQHGAGATGNYRMLSTSPGGKRASVLAWAPTDVGPSAPVGFTNNEFGRGLDTVNGATPPATKYTIGYYGSNGLSSDTVVTVTTAGTTAAVTAGKGGFFGPDNPVNIAARAKIINTSVSNSTTSTVSGANASVNGMSLFCGGCHTAYTSPDPSNTAYKNYTATATYTYTSGLATNTVTSTDTVASTTSVYTTIVPNKITTTAVYTGNAFRHPTEVDASGGNRSGYNPAAPIQVINTNAFNGTTTTSTATMEALRLASNQVGPPHKIQVVGGTAQTTVSGTVTSTTAVVGGTTAAALGGNWGNQAIATCTTCHNAHGSSAAMVGFAQGASPAQYAAGKPAGYLTADPSGLLGPDVDYQLKSSTLLAGDNRAMCEACHLKGSPTYPTGAWTP